MASFLSSVIGTGLVLGIAAIVGVKHLERSRQPASQAATAAIPFDRNAAGSRSSSAPSSGEVTLMQGRGGHYVADVEVHGRRVAMMVDTGASVIALSDRDARYLGVAPNASDYVVPMSTANGTIRAARALLREVRIQNIAVRNVPAVVMPRGALEQSLLGMSFLGKLRGYEVAAGRLVLRP